ncbi:MAG: hypothetical protein AAF564_06230 [Bacteroidota bacterium]
MSTSPNIPQPKPAVGFKAPIIIFFLFLCSVLLRTHAFEESIRGGHVWLTAHTVMTMQIWFEDGLQAHHYSPVYTYNNDADRNIRSLTSGIPDENGNYYYVSYGPVSFLLAYLVLKTTGMEPSLFALQFLNLIIHFLTSLLIYIILCRFYRKRVRDAVWVPALVGSIIYLFSMHPLWCHTYVYFADTLIQLLWASGIYMVIQLFLYNKIQNWRYVLGFGVLVFVSIQTEWIGLLFAAIVFCFATLYAFKDKHFFGLMGAIALATCLALGLFVYQYASINGLDEFLEASFQKYFQRSGYDKESWYFTQIELMHVLKHYRRLYYPIAGMILFLLLASFTIKRTRMEKTRKQEFTLFLSILIVPILLHHSLFLGFTKIHDFALLKSSLLAAFVIGMLYNRCTFHAEPDQKKFYHIVSSAIISLMLMLSLLSFYDFDRFEYKYIYERVASMVKATAADDEALFIISERDRENGIMVYIDEHRSISPQVQMIARRNLLGIAHKSDAFAHLQRYNLQKGRIYTISTEGHIITIEPITIDEAKRPQH